MKQRAVGDSHLLVIGQVAVVEKCRQDVRVLRVEQVAIWSAGRNVRTRQSLASEVRLLALRSMDLSVSGHPRELDRVPGLTLPDASTTPASAMRTKHISGH